MSNQEPPLGSTNEDISKKFFQHSGRQERSNSSQHQSYQDGQKPIGMPSLTPSSKGQFRPISGSQQPFVAQSVPQMSPVLPAEPQVIGQSELPQRSKPRHHVSQRLLLALSLVAILVIGGSFVGQTVFLQHQTAQNTKNTSSVIHTNAFVTPPLTSGQIDALRHLTNHMKQRQLAYLAVTRMSLDEEIGQIMMVEYSENGYSPALDTMIHTLHAGGVIMYQRQINTLKQTQQDTAHMQKQANLPLLISADEEGWNVHRLTNIYPPRLSAHNIHDSKSIAVALNEGKKVAHDLLSVGINTNFAPDVDVSPDENYIGWDQRSFGDTPQDVITYAGAYMKAMQTSGAIASIKHFPGLGGAPKNTDPHAVFVTVKHTKEQLYATDLAPFNYFIHASDKMEQPGIIMSTDELIPAIDPTYISELSPTFMTKILRNELGYDGVAITDALTMLGVQVNGKHLLLPEAGVMALQAGNDMLLGAGDPTEMKGMITAIKVALNNGTLSKSRLDEAATRIVTLKMERNLIPSLVAVEGA